MSDSLWVGTRKGLFLICKNGSTWEIRQTEFLGVQAPIICTSPTSSRVYDALKHGHFGPKIHRSDDAGRSWQEVATPKYPIKPDHVPDVIDPVRNKPIPWNLELIWSMEPTPSGKVWCGTLPGGLFSSVEFGESWQLNMPLWNVPNRQHWFGGGYEYPGIHSICIDPRDAKMVTVGISCGGVWQTQNDGRDWHCRATGMRAEYMPPDQAFNPDVQDPHRLAQCSGSPNNFWVQHHNGIFRSADDCKTWQEIDAVAPSRFGFAVAAHPTDPQTAWFVPAVKDEDRYPVNGEFVVTRTRDGGASFDVLRVGLPQKHAYHLVYRHALAIDATGQVLAMGSTTGGLWISEDAGDQWQNVSQDLPPIYCARFACN